MSPKVLRLPLRSAREYPDKMFPLSRVQDLSAKNRELRQDNEALQKTLGELRSVAIALTRHFYLFNDAGRRKLERMDATMPEDALPILLASGSSQTDVLAFIAKLTAKDCEE